MKSALLRLFDSAVSNSNNNSSNPITLIDNGNDTFYTNNGNRNRSFRGSNNNNSLRYNSNNNNAGFPKNKRTQGRGRFNAIGKNGLIMRCDHCESVKHFIGDCPQKDSNYFNPSNRTSGLIMRCINCDSVRHFANVCPHPRDDTNNVKFCNDRNKTESTNYLDQICHIDDTVYVNTSKELINESNINVQNILLCESKTSAILDTGCVRTVCGEGWYYNYYNCLNKQDKNSVSTRPSNATFRFGDSPEKGSLFSARIPARIGCRNIFIETDVVHGDIPLLLSKREMERGGLIWDFNDNDFVTFYGEKVKLHKTSDKHNCLCILPTNCNLVNVCNVFDGVQDLEAQSNSTCNDVLINLCNINDKNEQTRLLRKLHVQFGHASVMQLGKL